MERNAQVPSQLARRTLLRGAVLGGTGIAAASLLAPANASAADAGNGLVFPGVDVVIDASHATPDAAALVRRYFARKSAHDLDGWMSFFSRDLITYIDAVAGAGFYSWNSLRDSLSQFMTYWPSDGRSYPTRILGDATSAMVFFTDTAGLFGPSEIRAVGVVNFHGGKITRQVDYWDGRHFGIANTATLTAASSPWPVTSFGESTVGETAAPAMRNVVNRLARALGTGDGATAADLFAPGAVFEDMPAHLQIVGPRSIGTYLTDASPLLPYAGGGTAVRHVVGSAVGGGYEWTAADSAVPRGVVALELDRWGKITRLTALWDGSLLDDSTLISLARTAIER